MSRPVDLPTFSGPVGPNLEGCNPFGGGLGGGPCHHPVVGDPWHGRGIAARAAAVCDWLGAALSSAGRGERAALAGPFAAIEPRLTWKRRLSARPEDAPFWHGHANAMILGPGGLEDRNDLWVGATVMSPGVTYTDHDHPPEEIYLSLAPGEWWNERMDWTDPGPGGAIYNPPGIRHKMRAGAHAVSGTVVPADLTVRSPGSRRSAHSAG